MLAFCSWLQHTTLITTIGETGWLYTSFEVLHYLSLFVLVGTSAVVNLQLLGLAGEREETQQFASDLLTFMWAGMILAIFSGFVMFSTEATSFFLDPLFRAKIIFLVLAIILAVALHKNIRNWCRQPRIPKIAKLAASFSLVFWLGVIVASVGLAIYTGL